MKGLKLTIKFFSDFLKTYFYFLFNGIKLSLYIIKYIFDFVYHILLDIIMNLINFYQFCVEIILNIYLEFLICSMQFFIYLSSLSINISRALQKKISVFQEKIKL